MSSSFSVSVPARCRPVLLEASEITPLAGDPNDDNYDSGVPDFGPPLVIGALGIVDAQMA
jgi:hypothetical protein